MSAFFMTSHALGQSVLHFTGSTPVASTSGVLHIPVPIVLGGQLGSIQVLTQGMPQRDFRDASTGTCVLSLLGVGALCTVDVTFTPTAPGPRYGAVVLVGSQNEVLGSQLLEGLATGPMAVIQPGIITTAAGSGEWIYRGDGVDALSAQIFLPTGMATNSAGDIFISDSGNNRIRRVDGTTNLISTYAGIGTAADSGDGGMATSAGITNPAGLALDGAGNLYFADSGNNAIRRIDAITHVITTVAGILGVPGDTGDGLFATLATLNGPTGITLDVNGNLYIADTANNAIRRVDALTHIMTTIAGGHGAGLAGDGGPATAAALNSPSYLAFGPDSLLYIADQANNAVRCIYAAGAIRTVVGTLGTRGYTGDGQAAAQATLHGPAGLAFDPAGNLYIADSVNGRIRRVDAVTKTITTSAGSDNSISNGDGGNATLASLSGPTPLFMDGSGNLFIGDLFHSLVRKISATSATLNYPVMRVSKISAPLPETIENGGNASLTLGTSVLSQAKFDSATTTCDTAPMAIGAACQVGLEFAPTQVGDLVVGQATFPSDAANSPIIITPYGQVLTVEPTTVSLTSATNPAAPGQAVLLTAIVNSADTGREGSVTFLDGTTQLATVPLDANGVAAFSTTILTLGQHSLVASYSGDANNASAISSVLLQKILQLTQITLQSSLNPSVIAQQVTFRAVITSSSTGITAGSIGFFDGTTAIGAAAIQGDGSSTLSTSSLTVGTHAITAQFAADASSLASQSAVLSQVVNRAGTTALLAVSPSTINVGETASFSVTVSSNGGPMPTGSVSFRSGATVLGTAALNGNGNAIFHTAGLPPGSDSITGVYTGDTSNAESTSPVVTVVVNRLATTTSLTTTGTPANAGSALTMTATVVLTAGLQADGALSGTLTFYDGAATVGTAVVDASGVATISTASLAVATHSLTALYSGSTNYAPSTSAVFTQVIQQSASTTALSVSATNVVANKPLTLTANVATAGVAASGTVTFSDEDGALGGGTLNSASIASVTLSTIPVGTHNVIATYSGDSNYATGKSLVIAVVIRRGQTSLVLQPSSTTLKYGGTLTLTSTLTTDGVLASNTTVTLTDGVTATGAVTVNNAGIATFSTASLAVGSHTLLATFAGDAGNNAATSAVVTIVVTQATTSTVLTTSATAAVFGKSVTLQAIVNSSAASATGTVTFQEGASVLGSAPLTAAGVASLSLSSFSVGQHTITAVYAGDTTHGGSTSAALLQTIVDGATVSLLSSANPAVAGLSIQWTAQVMAVDSGAGTSQPTGEVIFYDGTAQIGSFQVGAGGIATLQLSTLSTGLHTLTAKYSGGTLFAAASSTPLVQAINNATTKVSFTAGPSPATYATSLSMHAIVTGIGGTPTGTVTFFDGATAVGSATLAADASVSFATTSLLPGIHVLLASYNGDDKDDPAVSATVQLQVQQTTQTTLASDVNPALTLQATTLTATVHHALGTAATGSVTFNDGGVSLGTTSLDANGVAALPAQSFSAGVHAIAAVYSGDTGDFPSTAAALSLTVKLRPTSDAVTATAPSAASGGVFSLVSVLQWNGPLVPTGSTVFTSGGNVIGTSRLDAAGVATLSVAVNALPLQVTAVYSGDAVYAPSTSAVTSIGSVGQATNFTLSVNPTSVTMPTKKFAVAIVTMQSMGGFADTLSLGCLGLPVAATCTFDKDTVSLAADGSVSVKVTIDTGSPLTAGGEVSQLRREASTVMLGGLPAGALLGWLLLGTKRKRYGALLLSVAVLGALLPLSGCGTMTTASTPVGNYTIKISAAGLASDVTVTQGVSMVVTQ